MLRRAGRNPTSHVLARGQPPGLLRRMEQLLESTNGRQKRLRQRQSDCWSNKRALTNSAAQAPPIWIECVCGWQYTSATETKVLRRFRDHARFKHDKGSSLARIMACYAALPRTVPQTPEKYVKRTA
jgi:hypothetical protein